MSKPRLSQLGSNVTSATALRRQINMLTERVNFLSNLSIQGGVSRTSGSLGTTITLPAALQPGGDAFIRIAEVQQAATGGGYYDCFIQKLDSTDWDTDTDGWDDLNADEVIVQNIGEQGAAGHNLSAGALIACWFVTDDEGTPRLVGVATLATTSITVVTDVDVNGASSIITKKTRANVLVLGTDAESGDTTIHTGTECP